MAAQSVLQILIEAVDESAAALEGAQNNLKSVAQEAVTTGTEIAAAGAAITAIYGGVVDSAAKVQESQDGLRQAVVDAMTASKDSSGAYSTQVSFLEGKINSYKASIAQAESILATHTGSTIKVAAAHQKAAADIENDQIAMAKYQEQLDILKNAQELSGESLDDITSKLNDQADANVNLGFSIADSTRSLSQAFTATKNLNEAMQVNQAAMDLARAKNIDLATATNQVILAMNGQGRALAAYGIQIKDGLSGMQALAAVQGAVNGQAQAYAGTLTGQLAVAMQSFNKLLADLGNTQLPILTRFLEIIIRIVDAVDAWTQKHQKLTEYILLFIGVLGVLLTVTGSLLVIFGSLALVVLALGAPFLLLIGLVAVLATIIIANWQKIADNISAIWDAIKTFFTNTWNWIKSLFSSSLTAVSNEWTAVWTGMTSFLEGIWDKIRSTVKAGFNDIISGVNAFINALNAIHISIPSIQLPGTKLSTPSLNLGFSIPNVPYLAEGGWVTQPTLAVIGESGPEAVMPLSSLGGGPGGNHVINVYIQGGYYLDQKAAKDIGDSLARQIQMQLKLRNYAA